MNPYRVSKKKQLIWIKRLTSDSKPVRVEGDFVNNACKPQTFKRLFLKWV